MEGISLQAQKFESFCPSPNHRLHIGKKVSLIAFKQFYPKILPAVYIFSNTIMTIFWKSSLEINPLIQNSVQQDYPPKPLWENPGDEGEDQQTAKNLLIFLTKKILLNIHQFSSPSNSNFHLITLYKIHL